jgi:site-specific recombinase XerC
MIAGCRFTVRQGSGPFVTDDLPLGTGSTTGVGLDVSRDRTAARRRALLLGVLGGGVPPVRSQTFARAAPTGAAEGIGVPGFHAHELQHTAASLAIASGADVKVVQQMLGHKSATMTLDLYGHLFGDRLDVVADAMDTARRRLCRRCTRYVPGRRCCRWLPPGSRR